MTQSNIPIPSWLETPPNSSINPPVVSKKQELPFEELSWEDFEKLCLRLVRMESTVEYCQLYGVRGQDQEGIDIYARQKLQEKYRVYQCKREKDFNAAKIKSAVNKFLEGDWVSKSGIFVLCTIESLVSRDRADEFENQSKILQEKGITLLSWDSQELSIKLKEYPRLVDDFFGRAWVSVFCGEEASAQLGRRLNRDQIIEFRQKLIDFYKRLFGTHDPGLPVTSNAGVRVPSFESRVVIPDVYDKRLITNRPISDTVETQPSEELMRMKYDEVSSMRKERPQRSGSLSYDQRLPIERWLIASSRNVILGGPGSGKSTFLRYLAIDLLQRDPKLDMTAQKWGEFLPVWVPFAYWTKIISNPATYTHTIGQMLRNWLSSWSEEQIWPLIEQALEDERLLLLVDGLDEWSNEQAAQIALDRLLVYEKKDVPVIITSRPHGFARFGLHQAGWQTGELCDFSSEQQKLLSRIWFKYKIRSLSNETFTETDIERKAVAEADVFLNELNKSPDLREIAKVPLLLCLLIYLRFQNVKLPQSRFKAYAQLIEHLISAHPQRRRTAAGLTEPLSELTNDELRSIYSNLAFVVQKDFSSGVIDYTNAVKIVEDFLKDSEQGLGLEISKARRLAKVILEIGEETIGLIVKKSQTELGFFHRAFQEYLSAIFLSSISIKEQLKLVENYCPNPQWREVILGLLHMNNRKEDIKQFVDLIKSKPADELEKNNIDLLISDIVFGDSNCSVSLARELSEDIFKKIETGTWMPHRERLLQRAMGGLKSTKVKELVRAKLMRWFPGRRPWERELIYKGMANWSKNEEVVDCLFKGLHDEEVDVKRAAAKSLARLANGDVEIGDRIFSIAMKSPILLTRVASTEALLLGWPKHAGIDRLLKNARVSMSPELRLIAIIGLIQNGKRSDLDLSELFTLGSWSSGLGFEWHDDITKALLKGWPKSEKTKQLCLESTRRGMRDDSKMEDELALRILLEGYPQDEEIAQLCINEIKHQPYPLRSFGRTESWRLLSQNFKDHPGLVAELDEWLPKQKFLQPEVTLGALAGRTSRGKEMLLSMLDKQRFLQWPAAALLEGWGMQDLEVASKLTKIAYGPAMPASWIGHLIPQIIKDRTACKERLIALLRDPDCDRYAFVLDGLKELGTQGKVEIVDILLEKLSKQEIKSLEIEDVVANLIVDYSSDARIRGLAKKELVTRGGNISAVAAAFNNDPEIRQNILDLLNPLPVDLRGLIAKSINEGTVEDAFTAALLKNYDFEESQSVKSAASVAYHTVLKELNLDPGEAIDYLSSNITCIGHDYEERRQAMFCGLVVMNRLDVIVKAMEGKNEKVIISIGNSFRPNVPLVKLILQKWDLIKIAFGEEFYIRINGRHDDMITLWNIFCAFADEYPSPRDEAIKFFEERKERTSEPDVLRFLGRVKPKSSLLLEYCLHALTRHNDNRYYSFESVLTASELLGYHFKGDSDVLSLIIKSAEKNLFDNGVIAALCEGWPESSELAKIFDLARQQDQQLPYAVYFRLISTKSRSEIIYKALKHVLSENRIWSKRDIHQPIVRRLKTDDELYKQILSSLFDKPTSSEKASIPRLISLSRGVSPELREWCIKEMNSQLSGIEPPEIGADLFVSALRPVAHSLMDVLDQTGPVGIS